MKHGLYEKVIDIRSKKENEDKEYKKIRNVDRSEVSRVLSTAYQKAIREALSEINDNTERIKFTENLNKIIGI